VVVESGLAGNRPDAQESRAISLANVAAFGLAALTLLSAGVVVLAHLGDRYQIDHVAGSWIGLASYLDSGTFYPELYDGSSFGGTRFMPLYFVLHALLNRVTGDYLVSGKVLSAAFLIGLIALTFAIVRRSHVPRSFALLLASLVLLTESGIQAASSIRADGLATVLGIGAVALIESRGPKSVTSASVLAAAATLTKVSALWAPVAIAVWLFLHHRRSLVKFAAPFVGILLVFGFITQAASEGRFLENLGTLAFGGVEREYAAQKASRYTLTILLEEAPAIWALVPFVLASWAIAIRERQLTIYHFAWLASVVILFVVMTDLGTGINHLLEPIVLSSILLGTAWWARPHGALTPMAMVLMIAVLWTSGSVYALDLRPRAQEVVVPLVRGTDLPQPDIDTLLAQLRDGSRLLAEDASIPVARGELPIVLDPWMLSKIEVRHPEWVAQLAQRIEAAEFDYIVLLFRFESTDPEFSDWYRAHFGRTVMSAIEGRYRWFGEADGFQLYVPELVPMPTAALVAQTGSDAR